MRVFSVPSRTRTLSWTPFTAGLLGLGLLAGCNDYKPNSTSATANPVGTYVDHPDPLASGSLRFLVEENSGGQSATLKITAFSWGRLVKVRDQLGVLQHSDMVVGEDIVSDNVDYLVETNAVTGETTVTILHPYTPSVLVGGIETSPYQRAFARLDRNLSPIDDKGLDVGELPPYSLVPRNAVMVVRFNDLLDATTVAGTNVRVFAGYPPETPLDTRILIDPNHGELHDADGDGIAEFHSTRILIDPAVSPFEAGISDPPLSPNATGLPPSVTENQPNVALRIPTRLDSEVGQNSILRNLSGHAVAFSSNGSNDNASVTRDIVRAARSGGETEATGDVNNGFLADTTRPRVLGNQAVVLGPPVGGPTEFTSTLTFLVPNCAMPTKVGDVLEQPGVFGEVLEVALPIGTQIAAVRYRVVFPAGGVLSPGQATLNTVWDPVVNQNKQACFVRFPSVAQPPATRVSTDSSVVVRFNEPMDPASVSPFESMLVTNILPVPGPLTERSYVLGTITPGSGAQEFRLEPSLRFKHTVGASEAYFVTLPNSAAGVTDLAGNLLLDALPPVTFTIDPSEATENTATVALRFTTLDEIGANGLPEWRGQYQIDFIEGVLEPRSVVHFSAPIDRNSNNLVVNAMNLNAVQEQAPLARLGSKLMTLWRYFDAQFLLRDEGRHNVDVEGMAWAPSGGNVVADNIALFEISMAHSGRAPDEGVNATGGTFPASGLNGTYNLNVLSPTSDPQRIVHPRSRGYSIDPSQRYAATSGTVMMPWPLNRGIPTSEFQYYTWRDTTVLERGGTNGDGAEPWVTRNVGFEALPPAPNNQTLYTAGNVRTIALPLLLEFRCLPDLSSLGLNVFDTLTVRSLGGGAAPIFRAHSTGGVNATGVVIERDPDLEATATGGFAAGAATAGTDSTFYLGELNLVTRVSRVHSLWFDTTFTAPIFGEVLVEPAPEAQPTGTSVVLAFRGATNITAGNLGLTNALALEFYGDLPGATPNTGITFLNNDATWKTTLDQLNGARFYQVRMSLIGNAATNLAPDVTALGVSYR